MGLSAPLTQTDRKPRGPYGPAGAFNFGQGILLQGQRPLDQQMPPQMGVKRYRISPLEEVYFNDPPYIPLGSHIFQGSLLNNESSPPERKRVRRSSSNMDQLSMSKYPHPQSQIQPSRVGPQSMSDGVMVRQGLVVPEPTNNVPYGPSGVTRKRKPGMTLPLGALSVRGAIPPGMTPTDKMIMQVSEACLKFSPC